MTLPPRNIVWIASYPKSGNTWVRFLVCNLLFGRQDSAHTLNARVPDIHELGAQAPDDLPAGIFKTHFVYSAAVPLAQRTAAAIYVVRHPADVLVSNFHYSQRSVGGVEDSQIAFGRYFDAFVQNRGDPRWIQMGMGSWDGNVRSWLGIRHPFPVILLKYEEMMTHPRNACEMLAKLLKPNSTAAEIDAAIVNSSFTRMREIEDADIRDRRVGIFYKPYLQASIADGRRFMRSGTMGEGVRRLTVEQRARLQAAFAPLLKELDYSGE
jgi:hypothetical protein